MAADLCPHTPSGFPAQLFLSLINALMQSKCELEPANKYPEDFGSKIFDEDEFDFIVIGSGSAGSVVAHELAKNSKFKILVLEAGGVPSSTSEIPGLFFHIQQTGEDWQYTTEKSSNACLSIKEQKCRWPRGKLLGGCSSINAMLYIRGNKKDFDQWQQYADGWDYDSVVPYFKMSENYTDARNEGYFGTEGLLSLQNYDAGEPVKEILFQAAKELGFPTYTHEHNIGYFTSLFAAEGTRQNTAKAYLKRYQRNLKVAHHSFVERLIIDSSAKEVTGVLVKIKDQRLLLRPRKEVIVSAGVINTPQLLLLSGIGPQKHLESKGITTILDLPVGQNLQDHLCFWGFPIKLKELTNKPGLEDELYKYFMYQKGKLSNVGLLNTMGFINTKNDSSYPNIQYHHVLSGKSDPFLKQTFEAMGFKQDLVDPLIAANENSTLFFIIPTLLNPKSKGEILLKTNNPYDKPLIYANYFQDSDDLEVMLEGIRFAEKLLQTDSFQKLKPQVIDLALTDCKGHSLGSDDYWRCYLRNMASTVYHPVGTCALGSVVNSRLIVKGIKNLRVIDASIMPTITSGNTHAPTMMIGQKGATMVLEDWGLKEEKL